MNSKQLAFAAAGTTSLLVVGLAFARTAPDVVPAPAASRAASAPFASTTRAHDLLAGARDGELWLGNRAWQLAVDRLSSAELSALLAEIAGLPNTQTRVALQKTVFARWAELDPAAAAVAVAELPPGDERAEAGGIVFLEWLRTSPRAALAWAERDTELTLDDHEIAQRIISYTSQAAAGLLAAIDAMPQAFLRDELRRFAFERLAATDPTTAVAYAQRQPAGPGRDALLAQALAAFAKQDPTTALARAASLPDSLRQTVLTAAACATAARDPLDALALLDQLPAGPARMEAARSIVAGMAREDPDAAVEFALTFPAGRMRESLLSSAAHAFATDNAPAALRWLQTMPDGAAKSTLLDTLSWRLVQAEAIFPATAVEFALSLPPGYRRNGVFSTAVERMAKQDVAATAAWLQTFSDPTLRPTALQSLAEAWPQNDASGAFAYALHLSVDTDRLEFLSSFGSTLARNPATAATLLAQLPAGPARDTFAQGVVSATWHRTPAEAAAFVDAMGLGRMRAAAAANVAQGWARSDPTAAARWVETRPDLANNAGTCAAVVDGWAQWDPDGAAAWLARLPAGPGRSGAAVELVDELKATAPATAARWTSEIADAEQRHRAIARLAAPWLAADRATASAWLARTDLPRETQQTLLDGRPVPDAEDEFIVLSPFEPY